MTLSARIRRIVPVWAALALTLSFWLVVPFMENNYQTEWIRVAMVVFLGSIIFTTMPAFRAMFLEDTPANAQQSIVGGQLIATGLFGSAVWLLLWRAAGFPAWMILADINGFFLWMILVGAFFQLIAPKDFERIPPRTRWGRVYLAALFTIVLGYTFIILRPDVKPFVEALHPYLSSR